MLEGRKIIVLGAGIGGLAAALCLRHCGAEVTVLEQAGEIREVGAGLQISPNGLAVLRALGLEQTLAHDAVRARAVVLRDFKDPREVLRLDLTRLAPGQTYYFVHRADLIGILGDAARAAGIRLLLLQKADRVVPGTDGVSPAVHLNNGGVSRADLVIGADGLHSVARKALNGEDEARFTGHVAWRAVVPNTTRQAAEAQVFMGPGRHLVTYPLRGGAQLNLVAVQERAAWVREGWNITDDPANLRAAFTGFGGSAQVLLEQVREVGLWGLFRHPVAPAWYRGGVALVGDAAHPTLPFLAQGANMALEDAWVLSDSLSRAATPTEGLALYQARRRDRVVRVIQAASGNAWKYHLRARPVRRLAHLGLRLGGRLAPERMVRQFDWLYGHDVTATPAGSHL